MFTILSFGQIIIEAAEHLDQLKEPKFRNRRMRNGVAGENHRDRVIRPKDPQLAHQLK
jgi:hypothetical protein